MAIFNSYVTNYQRVIIESHGSFIKTYPILFLLEKFPVPGRWEDAQDKVAKSENQRKIIALR